MALLPILFIMFFGFVTGLIVLYIVIGSIYTIATMIKEGVNKSLWRNTYEGIFQIREVLPYEDSAKILYAVFQKYPYLPFYFDRNKASKKYTKDYNYFLTYNEAAEWLKDDLESAKKRLTTKAQHAENIRCQKEMYKTKKKTLNKTTILVNK